MIPLHEHRHEGYELFSQQRPKKADPRFFDSTGWKEVTHDVITEAHLKPRPKFRVEERKGDNNRGPRSVDKIISVLLCHQYEDRETIHSKWPDAV